MSKTVENQQTKELSDDDDDETNDETDEEGDIHDNPEDIITLNIGGVRHETRIQTLRKLTRKTTRLSEVADIAEKTGKREFYFDRQPDIFPYILNFYRQGKLHLPLNLCGMILRDELKYWMIDDKDIEQCCWVHYIKYEETHEMLDMFDRDEKHNRLATKRIKADASRFERIRPKLWRFLQDPYSSRGATVSVKQFWNPPWEFFFSCLYTHFLFGKECWFKITIQLVYGLYINMGSEFRIM